MHIRILDQCSSSKAVPDDVEPLNIAEVDAYRSGDRQESGISTHPARKLYQGRQHGPINEATERLRESGHAVDRYYVSAGFGIVGEDEQLPPYNVTFSGMTATEIDDRAAETNIPSKARTLVSESGIDMILFPLGSDYARAVKLGEALGRLPEDTIAVIFGQKPIAAEHESTVSIPAGNAAASRFGSPAVELKGHYIKRLAEGIVANETVATPEYVKHLCMRSD